MSAPLLELQGITKRFGRLVANDGVDLRLESGQVVALLGENGAGKSTLMSILFGHYVPDAGSIQVLGQALPPGDTRAALAAGVGMVHQHFTLAENLTVLDNVIAGTEPLWLWRSQRQQARDRLMAAARQAGFTVDPDAIVAELSVGERQRVEILKVLYRGARILILDEPTSVLTPQEAQSLFETLRQLLAQGMGIIFISHKLDEVMAISDQVVVLRHGRVVATAATAQTSVMQLARAMVGESQTLLAETLPVHDEALTAPQARTDAQDAHAPAAREAPARLQLQKLCAQVQRQQLHDMDLTVRAGEILGIAGVSGNGQGLLADVLAGVAPLQSGQVLLDGQALPAGVASRTRMGLARVPEDRQAAGVVGDLTVWENACAEVLATGARSVLARWGWIRSAPARHYAQSLVKSFDVRGADLGRRTRALSGGNVQKLILGRVLKRADQKSPPLVVAHQPTWGLDVGAVGFVHAQLRAVAAQGAAVLIISDDLDELERLCDTLAVICQGRLSPALPRTSWNRASLGLAMAGQMPQASGQPLV